MKFQLAINLERIDDSISMQDVARHTLEMVQMADRGGFNIVWSAEHHALEMTIAPNPFSLLAWWANHTDRIRLGTACVAAAYWHPIRVAGDEVDYAIKLLHDKIDKLRELSPLWEMFKEGVDLNTVQWAAH